MKRGKYLAALAALATVSLLAGGCGKSGETKAQTPQEAVMAASEKLQASKSMTYDLDMTMKMKVAGSSMDMTMKGAVKLIQKPLQMEMDMDMAYAGGSQKMKTFMEESGKDFAVYTGVDLGGQMQWTKTDMKDASAIQSQYDAAKSMEIYTKGMKDFKKAEKTEKVGDLACVRYDGKVDGKAIGELVKGLVAQFQQAGNDTAALDAMANVDAEIPVSFWISEKDGTLQQYKLEMAEYMDKFMKKYMESAGGDYGKINMEVSELTETIKVTGIDNVEKITIPEEAKKAS